VIQPTAIPGLSVLAAGPKPSNPSELLTSPAFAQLLEKLREEFELVIVDTPPMLAVTDPAVVAPRVDGVLLVLRWTRISRPGAEQAKDLLDAVGANVLGVVVNEADPRFGPRASAYHSDDGAGRTVHEPPHSGNGTFPAPSTAS
jgi:capsular exopolysaccharide synthesis family protein